MSYLGSSRDVAYLRAFDLLEAVQGDSRDDAVAALPVAIPEAEQRGWPDVAFVLAAASAVHAVTHGQDEASVEAEVTAVLSRAERLANPASMAMALGLRALARARTNDTGALIADASRAVALLDGVACDDATDFGLDRGRLQLETCVGYVIAAAAFNTLRLWELVDEMYGRALELGDASRATRQTTAVAVNRVLIRLEWAVAVLESGDDEGARAQLRQVLESVPAALAEPTPDLWRRNVLAAVEVVRLLRGDNIDALLPLVKEHRRMLAGTGDFEVMPKLEAATALALWRKGRVDAALAAVRDISVAAAVSSGARSFPLWARAVVLAAADPSTATAAQTEYGREVGRLLWQSRLAVLAAARAQIAIEQRRAEHEALSRAVNTDALTGLYNRRAFDSWLRRPLSATNRFVALLLIDIDNFKDINDTYGHDCGDEVLRALAAMMVSSVRPGDIAIRLGGDEFAVILEGDAALQGVAPERADKLNTAISGAPWSDLVVGLSVAVSIGVAIVAQAGSIDREADATEKFDAARLYKMADNALYQAKRSRSRVAVATASAPGENLDLVRDSREAGS